MQRWARRSTETIIALLLPTLVRYHYVNLLDMIMVYHLSSTHFFFFFELPILTWESSVFQFSLKQILERADFATCPPQYCFLFSLEVSFNRIPILPLLIQSHLCTLSFYIPATFSTPSFPYWPTWYLLRSEIHSNLALVGLSSSSMLIQLQSRVKPILQIVVKLYVV